MSNQWNLSVLQQYIADGVQENSNLEYKGADALGKTNDKKEEITKDVSAMANSSGGVLIYGIREFDEPDKRHLPERIDPIDQTQFSKEWLEQIVNLIRPRINGIVIHPVAVSSTSNHCVYVLEVPQSTTAHQAITLKYYRRFNFMNVPMQDYEIRDVMNRATAPDAHVEFGLHRQLDDIENNAYRRLRVVVTNQSTQVINRFKLILRLKNVGVSEPDNFEVTDMLELGDDKTYAYSYWPGEAGNLDIEIVYQSKEVLFPNENINIGGYRIKWVFRDNPKWNDEQWFIDAERNKWALEWTLYADSMIPKKGAILMGVFQMS